MPRINRSGRPFAAPRSRVRSVCSVCRVSTDLEELLDKLYCLASFVLRSEPDRDQITGFCVFRDELKALAGRNPSRAESLHQDEGLECASDNINPFLHALRSLVAGVDESRQVQGEEVCVDPIALFSAYLHGLYPVRGDARQQAGSVDLLNEAGQSSDRISHPRAVDVLSMDNADLGLVLDQKRKLLLVTLDA